MPKVKNMLFGHRIQKMSAVITTSKLFLTHSSVIIVIFSPLSKSIATQLPARDHLDELGSRFTEMLLYIVCRDLDYRHVIKTESYGMGK